MEERAVFTVVHTWHRGSWHIQVRAADGTEYQLGKRTQTRKDLTGRRKDWVLEQLRQSVLPVDGPEENPEAWEKLINEVHERWGKEMNSSRTMEAARQYNPAGWNGSVPISGLSRLGYHDLGKIDGMTEEDAGELYRYILKDARRSSTHGAAVGESPTTSVFLLEPGEAVEPWTAVEHTNTVKEEKVRVALRRVKEAVQAAVGKEKITSVITEGLVAKLGRDGRPCMTAYPKRHGDFIQKFEDEEEWDEEEREQAMESNYTPPVLAVMVVLSPNGAVPTLFPCLETKFTRSMGLQPVDDVQEGEGESSEYHERRFQRWELARLNGTGDQVPTSSASGAGSGQTDGGNTRAHPRRAGGLARLGQRKRRTRKRRGPIGAR